MNNPDWHSLKGSLAAVPPKARILKCLKKPAFHLYRKSCPVVNG
jgi:hypothetical protein